LSQKGCFSVFFDLRKKEITTDMTASSIGNLVGNKITLKKDEHVYLVSWVGTTKNELRSIGSVNGELPESIGDFETALLYKVLWTDKGNKE